MKQVQQTFEEIFNALLPVEASWLDAHAEIVISMLKNLPEKKNYQAEDVMGLLQNAASERRFEECLTVVRLFLELSKDEFTGKFRDTIGPGTGVQRFLRDSGCYVAGLEKMGLLEKMDQAVNRPPHWSDSLVERLKGGRGSAIKGQQRGRGMEDFVEAIVGKVFADDGYDVRCRFVGSKGRSTEKADFAIPSAAAPQILIEVKAYGATGSKQTDVLGDISRIVAEKRNDTYLFLVTDGITWKDRSSDLKKLVALQNEGAITRIYTKSMAAQLNEDLKSLRRELDL